MHNTNYRKVTRSQAWPDTEATIKVTDTLILDSRSVLTFKGSVGDLGSSGMFLITPDVVPVPAKAEIIIDFDPGSRSSKLKITAIGETVRSTNEGVGIKFTTIDLAKLQQCIISKMNKTENNTK